MARRDYIQAVRVYNAEVKTFPGVVWASTLYKSNKPLQEFTVAEDLKQPPQVQVLSDPCAHRRGAAILAGIAWLCLSLAPVRRRP